MADDPGGIYTSFASTPTRRRPSSRLAAFASRHSRRRAASAAVARIATTAIQAGNESGVDSVVVPPSRGSAVPPSVAFPPAFDLFSPVNGPGPSASGPSPPNTASSGTRRSPRSPEVS